MSARRAGRGPAAAVIAVAMVLAPSAVASPAWGEDAIMSQEYVAAMGLDQLKAQGFDGSGVTVAVIDNNVDLTVPELAGADIDVKASCAVGGASHGTSTVSDLADPVWGWAPRAHFLVYGADGLVGNGVDASTSGCGGGVDDMIQRAITDGADIINISAGIGPSPYTLARAAMRGIPIVIGSGNFGKVADDVLSPYNTVVIVGATDMAGNRSDYSGYGPGLTVMAPADPNTYRMPDDQGNLTRVVTSSEGGTSTAAPMVTGALALAMQKWPDANGNQLIASLIATSDRAGHWDEHYGWGMVDPAALISNDPSQYSTENPLMDAIPDADPTQEQYEDYVNGTVEFASSISPYDDDYVPASASASASPSAGSSGGVPGWALPAGLVVLVVVAGVVLVVVLASRRRRAAPASPARPPAGYPAGPHPAQAYSVPPPGYPQGYSQVSPQGYPQPQPPPWVSPQPQNQPPPGWSPPPSSYPPGGPHA